MEKCILDKNKPELGIFNDKPHPNNNHTRPLRLHGGCNSELEGFFQNTTSIVKDFVQFQNFFQVGEFDFIGIAETWLKDYHYNTEFAPTGYQIFRNDRPTRGGGVLLMIKEELKAVRVPITTNLEIIAVKIQMKNCKLLIVLVYLPPPLNREMIDSLEYSLNQICLNMRPQDRILIMGDFNTADYAPPEVNNVNTHSFLTNKLITTMTAVGCEQYVNFATCNQHFLDQIWSNSPVNTTLGVKVLPSIHDSVIFTVPFSDSSHGGNKITVDFNFFKTNWQECKDKLSNVKWYDLLSSEQIDCNWNSFYNTVNEVIACTVPKKVRRKKPFPIYFDHETVKIIKQKNVSRRKYLKSKQKSDFDNYSSLRKQVKNKVSNSRKNYLKNMYSNFKNKNNPKPFWKYIRNLGSNKNNITVLHKDNNQFSEAKDQVNILADHFASVYTSINEEEISSNIKQDTIDSNIESFCNITLTRQEVYMQLLTANSDKAKGPDNVPPIFFKNCAWELSLPLTKLFNDSLNSGIFPTCLKSANVSPIFKKGDPANAGNYRPISLLSYVSKLFETLVQKYLYNHVKKYISNEQHGFCEGRSTITNLCTFWNYVVDAIDEGWQVDAIYTDFAKAFDTVNHNYLVHKLTRMGIHGRILNWCDSYLRDRYQTVTLNGYRSKSILVKSGVPQGSALGPLFFTIFINDLSVTLKNCNILHLFFADDLKIYYKIKSATDHAKLQSALDCLAGWSNKWGLKLNIEKCQIISFHSYRNLYPFIHKYTINQTELDRVYSINDLGITLQSNCLFTQHVTNIVNKAFRKLGFIKRSLFFVNDIKTVIAIYSAVVRCILIYGSVVWNPSQAFLIHELERVQRHFIRYVCYKFGFDRDNYSYEEWCNKFEIPTLQHFRTTLGLNFLYNLLHGRTNCSELLKHIYLHIPSVATRTKTIFGIPSARTDYKRRVWHYFLPTICNRHNLNPFVNFSTWKRTVRGLVI